MTSMSMTPVTGMHRGPVWRRAILCAMAALPTLAIRAADLEDPAEAQRQQQIKLQAQHLEPQFTKLLSGELELIRSVCGELPRESRRKISQAGVEAVKQAALESAAQQFGGRLAGDGDQRPAQKRQPANPAAVILEALDKSLAEQVPGERVAAYREQVAQRNDRQKRAMIRQVVATLDAELFLTSTQWDEIERSLSAAWEDRIFIAMGSMNMINGRRVFPGLLQECVRPHLTEPQRQQLGPSGASNDGQIQNWSLQINQLGNIQDAGRDPWWFE